MNANLNANTRVTRWFGPQGLTKIGERQKMEPMREFLKSRFNGDLVYAILLTAAAAIIVYWLYEHGLSI